jgi:hypothetical protein
MTKNRISIFLSLAIAIALSSCAGRGDMPGRAFEGTITEAIQVPGIGELLKNGDSSQSDGAKMGLSAMGAIANMGLKMYVRENKVAYDVSILGGLITMHSIIDRDARTLTTLMPNHTAIVTDLRALDTSRGKIDDSIRAHSGILDSLQAIMPQPTGNHETIHGLDAEEYHGTKGKVETDLWLTTNDKIKAFDIVRDAFLGRGTAGTGGLDEIFEIMRPIAGKIPVKFETKLNGNVFAKGEMTDITEEKLDDAIFEIPKDYQIVDGDSLRASRHRSHSDEDDTLPKPKKQERHNVTAP